jgi:uncharacterized protein
MRRIAVFARRPVPGRVKTRLSPALPAALACDLHHAMLDDAIAVARAASVDERFLYWDRAEGDVSGAGERAGDPFATRAQCEGDLGARLSAAFAELLRDPDDRAIVIGSDCPSLDAAVVDAGFAALETRDVVVGPTSDGGYYLIGLSRPAPALFRGIDWGTERVLMQTLEAARSLACERLIGLDDLDTPADLVRWIGARASAADPPSGVATAGALRKMRLLP